MSQKKINVNLPAPHPGQQKIIQEAKRYNVVCCGRRFGKTMLGMDRLVQAALAGKRVAWFSPTRKLMADTWRELQSTLQEIIAQKNEQEQRLELLTGGIIELWSLDGMDAGRGRKYDLVVIDEAAMIAGLSESWTESIRPTLVDRKGLAWFLSTPRGMNYFKFLFDLGQDPNRKAWASWQMPTSENPHIAAEEIEAARLDMSEGAFNQEFLAQFVDGEGSVFRCVNEAVTASVTGKPQANHEYMIGVDWGRSNDYTVFIVLDTTTHTVVIVDRFNRVDYTAQLNRLKALAEKWRPTEIIVEKNNVGQPLIEQLTRDGLKIQPFNTTNASKAKAIEALMLAFERHDIFIPADPVLIGELVAFQSQTLRSGLTRYAAPNGQHDDTVMALAMAWSAIERQQRRVYPIPDSAIVVKPCSIPDHWPRAYAVDIEFNTLAAIWGAKDPVSGVVYLYSEYLAEADLQVHAKAIKDRRDWIPGLIDPAGYGRSLENGKRLVQMYSKHGVRLQPIENPLESGILEVGQRMRSGHLKVFEPLTQYLEERRVYLLDEAGKVVKERDHLQNAVRCLVAGISRMQTKRTKRPLPQWYFNAPGGDCAWMA